MGDHNPFLFFDGPVYSHTERASILMNYLAQEIRAQAEGKSPEVQLAMMGVANACLKVCAKMGDVSAVRP